VRYKRISSLLFGCGSDPMYEKDHLNLEGFLRLTAIIGPRGIYPVSKSSWWEGVRQGRYPAPVRLGPRTVAWRVSDIRSLIERVAEGPEPSPKKARCK
jgi:predicted DNA-binding transcriptional regulator AlpA